MIFFVLYNFILGFFCITLKYFYVLSVTKIFSISSVISNDSQVGELLTWITYHAIDVERKKLSDIVPYKISQKRLSIIQWVASFSPICYHKVILQDASTVFPEPILWCLWKPSLFINILKTFTLIQNFMKIQLQVIFQYCQNVHVHIETACYSWPAYKIGFSDVLMTFWPPSSHPLHLCSEVSPSFPSANPEWTFHSFEVCLQQLSSPEKVLVVDKGWFLSWQWLNVWSFSVNA